MRRLFRTKPHSEIMGDVETRGPQMHRALGAGHLTLLGIGGIIGAGIFVLTGTVAASNSGPAIVISFGLAGIACVLAGLCYAEFASMIPMAGSAYTYAYATLGELVAWIIGWDLVLEYAMGAATVAVGWAGYVNSFLRGFNIILPPEWVASPGIKMVNVPSELVQSMHLAMPVGWQPYSDGMASYLVAHGVDPATLATATGMFNLPAVLVTMAVTFLLIAGIRQSANFNAIIVAVKVAVVLAVIAVGFAFVDKANWHPFIPPNTTGKFGDFGWSGVFRGAGVIFFAYIGFDAVSTAAQESKRPQRDLPIGILASLGICTVIYILMGLVLTGVVPYKTLQVPDPIAVAVEAMGIHWLAVAVKLGAIAGLTSVILVLMLGQTRIFYSMSRDGLLPEVFSRLHKRFRTPWITTLVTGVVVSLVAALVPMSVIGELVSIGTLAAFVIVCASVIVLRRRHPELPRPFRTPWVPFTPILGIITCLALMIPLPVDTWLRLVIWMAVGFVIYFLYSRHNSKLHKKSSG